MGSPSKTVVVHVRQGECLNSIAARHGFVPKSIWDDPANAELKERRGDPNNLLPGDKLTVPARTAREAQAASGERHRFRRKGAVYLRLRVLKPAVEEPVAAAASASSQYSYEDPDFDPKPRELEPEANAAYVLSIEGRKVEGETDGDGRLEERIPPGATRAMLRLYPGTEQERVIPLALGAMDPLTEPIGIAKRLRNLGIPCPLSKELDADLRGALKVFQAQHDLDATGEADQATRDKLKELHGS